MPSSPISDLQRGNCLTTVGNRILTRWPVPTGLFLCSFILYSTAILLKPLTASGGLVRDLECLVCNPVSTTEKKIVSLSGIFLFQTQKWHG